MSPNPNYWPNDWAPPRNWNPSNYVPPNHVPPQTPSYQAPSYPVTNNNGYSWGQDLSRSSSYSTVVPGYNNPVDRSLSTDTTKR